MALDTLDGSDTAFVNVIVTTSPTLNPTTSGGGLDATTESTPGMHSAAPPIDDSGGIHGRQNDAFAAAKTALYRPDVQFVQLDTLVALACEFQRPTIQDEDG